MKILKYFLFAALITPAAFVCAQETASEDKKQPVEAGESSAKDTKNDKKEDKAKIEPYSSEYYQKFVTAAWYEKNGKKPEAFEVYEELDEITPKQIPIIKSLVGIAIEAEDTQAMAKYVPILMELAPNQADTFSVYATWLWSKGEVKEALEYYKKALDLDSENPYVIFKYATLLSTLDAEAAVKYLEGITLYFPKVAGAISLQIADLYLGSNKPDEAIKYLKQATKHNPDLIEPYLGRAKIYEHQGKMEDALQEYLALEDIGLGDTEILTKIGAFYVLKNDKDLAQSYFLKAKALQNDNPLAAQFLSIRAETDGDYAAAAEYLMESADYELNPSNFVRVSYFFDKEGKMDKAADTLKSAYTKFPENTEVAYYYSLALTDTGDYKTAKKVVEEILEKVPTSQPALFQYAFVLEREKQYSQMEKQLRKLLQLDPDNASALNFLGYYLVDKTKKIDEGGEYIKKAIALEPNDPAFIDSMGWYYYKKGDSEQALPLLKEAASVVHDSEILLHIAEVYEDLKDYKNASFYYRQALNLEPKNKHAVKGLKRSEKKAAKQ